jgi:hypothetical protein
MRDEFQERIRDVSLITLQMSKADLREVAIEATTACID